MTKGNGQPVRVMEKAFVDALQNLETRSTILDSKAARARANGRDDEPLLEKWAEKYHQEKALRALVVKANKYGMHFKNRTPVYAVEA
jgi:hypothetical protein